MAQAGSRVCLGSNIAYWAERTPDSVALDDGQSRISFAELDTLTRNMAQGLAGSGLPIGSRIAWLGKNSPLFFVLMIAASRAAMVIVPMGWRLAEPELRYILSDTGAALVVAEPAFTALAKSAADGLDNVRAVLTVGDALDEFLLQAGAYELPEGDPERAVLQLYTSGTTGNPKGAVLNNRNLFAVRHILDETPDHWSRLTCDDSLLVIMPVGHIAGSGSCAAALFNGSRIVIRAEFTPDAVLDAIDDGASNMFLVPTALQMVVNHPRAATTDFSRLKMVMYGAAPMPLELLRQSMKVMQGAKFCQQYGMTETTGTFCALPPEDHDPAGNDRMRSAGFPLPGVEAKIIGEDGMELPRGQVGEIITRSPLNMLEYWQNPDKTSETVDADGWLHTGDAAYMDRDGYIFIQDRIKDMIISGGENVYPAEVENAIFGHPDVLEVAVIGVPHEKWGESVKAMVVAKSGHEVDPDSVIKWARDRIAAFKAPKSVDVIAQMPRNASGKILRRELRDPYWQGRERSVN